MKKKRGRKPGTPKTGGRDFVKGDPRAGRPKTPEDLKHVKKLTKTEAELIITKYCRLSRDELLIMKEDGSLPAIDHLIINILAAGVIGGDHQRMSFVLDRLIGKVTDKVEHSLPKPTIIRGRDGETIYLGAERQEDE